MLAVRPRLEHAVSHEEPATRRPWSVRLVRPRPDRARGASKLLALRALRPRPELSSLSAPTGAALPRLRGARGRQPGVRPTWRRNRQSGRARERPDVVGACHLDAMQRVPIARALLRAPRRHDRITEAVLCHETDDSRILVAIWVGKVK